MQNKILIRLLGCLAFWCQALCSNAQDVNFTPSCPFMSGGVIEVTVTNQDYDPPFVFTLSNGLGIISQQEDDEMIQFTDLFPGTYCLSVVAEDGCSAKSCNVVVEEISTPILNFTTAC